MGNGVLGASVIEALLNTGSLLEKRIYGGLKACYDMDVLHIKIMLYLLDVVDDVKVSSLMSVAECTQAYVTLLVDKLEGLGFLSRAHSSTDRRVVHVKLTDAGRELAQRIKQDRETEFDKVFSTFPVENLEDLLEICSRVEQVLQEEKSEEVAA